MSVSVPLTLYHDVYPALEAETDAVPNLVLLHGWGMNSLIWDELVPLLNKQCHITLIDLPGMGRSPLHGGEYTLKSVCEKIIEVAPQRAIWLGWSLGGLCVQYLAQHKPEKIERAFLLAATPKFVASDNWPKAMPEKVFSQFQALLEEDWQGTLIRFLTLQCKGSESIREDTRKMRERLFHHGLPAQKALREGLNILKDNDLREALTACEVPIDFILGEYDTLIPQQAAQAIQALNPQVTIHCVQGASHVPQLSHAQAVAKIILEGVQRK